MNENEKAEKNLRTSWYWMLIVAAAGALIMTFPTINPIGLILMIGVTIAVSQSLVAMYPSLRASNVVIAIVSVLAGGVIALLITADGTYSAMAAYGVLAVWVGDAFELFWGITGLYALISEYADRKNPFEPEDKKTD